MVLLKLIALHIVGFCPSCFSGGGIATAAALCSMQTDEEPWEVKIVVQPDGTPVRMITKRNEVLC